MLGKIDFVMKILIAEDDKQIAQSLRKNFLEEEYEVILAQDGEKALEAISSNNLDIILLDWRMPKVTGIEVCKIIRGMGLKIPIILLTALSAIDNKVEALELGADDYITKPFSFEELMARIKSVLRRYQISSDTLLIGNLTLDLLERKIKNAKGKEVLLTDKEFTLIRTLINEKGEVFSREKLCKLVWGLNFDPHTNICDVTIKNLRKKLKEITDEEIVSTVYGEGYTFAPK